PDCDRDRRLDPGQPAAGPSEPDRAGRYAARPVRGGGSGGGRRGHRERVPARGAADATGGVCPRRNRSSGVALRIPGGSTCPSGSGGGANPRPRIRGLFRDSSTVEQTAVNRKVQGSNPCPGANVLSQDIEDTCCKTLCTGQRP